MKRFTKVLGIGIGLGLLASGAMASKLTPIGKWIQVSDKSHQPHSIIVIYKTNHGLAGEVGRAISTKTEPAKKYCTACEGKLHNMPMVGLVIMHGFKPVLDSNHEWSQGEILDPDSGSTYHCNLTLKDQGKKMDVRGYIGFPLFGRSQTWTRCTKKDKKLCSLPKSLKQ